MRNRQPPDYKKPGIVIVNWVLRRLQHHQACVTDRGGGDTQLILAFTPLGKEKRRKRLHKGGIFLDDCMAPAFDLSRHGTVWVRDRNIFAVSRDGGLLPEIEAIVMDPCLFSVELGEVTEIGSCWISSNV